MHFVGGCGTNTRPTDYEKYGPAVRVRYLHRYHGVVPPMVLIAPFALVTRSTNRSTPYHGDHRMPATERYRRPADHRMPAPGGIRPPKEGPPLLTAEPLDLECRRNTCRASRRPLEIRRIRSSGGPAVAAVRKGCSWPLLDLRQVAETLASRASVFLDTSASSRWARWYLPGRPAGRGARS